MSYVGVQTTLNLYTMREAEIQNQLTDVLMDITQATKQQAGYAQNQADEKAAVREQYDSSDREYQVEMDKITDEFEIKLADVAQWESELETKKCQMETEIKAMNAYEESFRGIIKQNISADFKYAQN